MSWYLRSLCDRDTHRGQLRHDGTVVALCGVTFRPRLLPAGTVALPGQPPTRPRSARSATARP